MIGLRVGARYELLSLLTDGPIFDAYVSRDTSANKDVVVRIVKQPFAAYSEFYQALKRSTDIYGAVKSQMIEGVSDVGKDGTHVYFVTDLNRGPTVADKIRKLAPFSIPVSVATVISICQALEPLHRYRLAHGDLAPSNIVIMANGDVKLQLAGIWEVYSSSPTAGAAVLPGMAPYLAPEVSAGGMPSTTSDVYALGVILFELLTGRQPYWGDTPSAIAQHHIAGLVPSVRDINPSAPVVLDEIVKKAMARDPAERYQQAAHLLADLRLVQDALRFGRTLSWPLRKEEPVAVEAPKRKSEPARQPVAPRMAQAREEEPPDRWKPKKERDLPIWMTVLLVMAFTLAASVIGFWMLMNVNRPQLIDVPNVVGLTTADARSMLSDAKLVVKLGPTLTSEKIGMDHVIQSSPAAGDKIREGSRVILTVSVGSRLVDVPSLKGLTLDKAKSILESLYLDYTIDNQPDDSIPAGSIVETDPEAKTKVERHSQVKLVVSSGQNDAPAEAATTPVGGGYLYTIHLTLSDIKESTDVRVEMTDDSGTRDIHDDMHDPGDQIEVQAMGKGKQAKFTIYYNDVKVKEVTKAADTAGGTPRDSN